MKDIEALLKEILLEKKPDVEYVDYTMDYRDQSYIITYRIYGQKDNINISFEDIFLFLYNKIEK